MGHRTITEREWEAEAESGPAMARPGLLIVFAVHEPRLVAIPAPLSNNDGTAPRDEAPGSWRIDLGRDELLALGVHDARVSRQHLRVEQRGGRWSFRDLGSTNGSWLDGQPLGAEPTVGRAAAGTDDARREHGFEPGAAHVLRIGRTVLLALDDLTDIERYSVQVKAKVVMGPLLQRAHERVRVLAQAGESLLITGESGVGKELAVRAYHAASAHAQGPLVAVNCATLPRDLAERLLFGARRGAYSGAVADSEGFIQAADGGTLFLDEVAELDLAIQAKLLRVLETHEVTVLGATRARAIDLCVCTATLRDLPAEVAQGRFREDLYFRIGRPAITLPPLRQRREEIAMLIGQELGALPGSAVPAGAPFIESCLLRPWPGNVRELCTEVRAAALIAQSEGAPELGVRHLGERAGWPAGQALPQAAGAAKQERAPAQLAQVLQQVGGNLSAAAQRLGIPRTTLRRLMAREGIELSGTRGGKRALEEDPS